MLPQPEVDFNGSYKISVNKVYKKKLTEVLLLSSSAKHHYIFSAFTSHNYCIFLNDDIITFTQNCLVNIENAPASAIGSSYNQLLGEKTSEVYQLLHTPTAKCALGVT